ncbi:MAG: PQQ-dependent sugar dehydrogenase [Bacteroidota bacterium]
MKKILSLSLAALAFLTALAQTPPYIRTTMISNLAYPVAFTFTPDGRYLITHKPGQISMYSPAGTFMNTFYDMSDSTYNVGERGLLGIEIDPNYANNGYVYVYYNHRCCVSTSQTGQQYARIVRFTEAGNVGTNPTIIFEQPYGNIPGFHVGGNLRFRPSEPDKIYFTMGDFSVMANAQLLSNPYGKVLRINTDGTIPADNPFYDDGNPFTGNDDRIWDYGHRNHFDLCASTINDSLYYSENGTSPNNMGEDEAGIIIKGANNGWATCEGFDNYGSNNPCTFSSSLLPIAEFPPVNNTMPAVTGILVYNGTAFPTLVGHLLVADVNFGRISDITLGNAPYYDTAVSNVVWDDFVTGAGFTTIKQGSNGCIYALEAPYSTTMRLHRICPTVMPGMGEPAEPRFSLDEVYPNPASGNFSVRLTMEKEARISVELFDVSGISVAVLADELHPAGTFSLHTDLGLSGGIYFVKLNVLDPNGPQTIYTQTLKLVVVR